MEKTNSRVHLPMFMANFLSDNFYSIAFIKMFNFLNQESLILHGQFEFGGYCLAEVVVGVTGEVSRINEQYQVGEGKHIVLGFRA